MEVLRPRCRNLECCRLKADSRPGISVVCSSALISGLNASWCLRATAHALDILSDQNVVSTPVVCSWQRQSYAFLDLITSPDGIKQIAFGCIVGPTSEALALLNSSFSFPLIYLDSHSTRWLDYSWLLILLQSRRKHLQCCYSGILRHDCLFLIKLWITMSRSRTRIQSVSSWLRFNQCDDAFLH